MDREIIKVTERQYDRLVISEETVIGGQKYEVVKKKRLKSEYDDGFGYEFILKRKSDGLFFETSFDFSYGELNFENFIQVFPKTTGKGITYE